MRILCQFFFICFLTIFPLHAAFGQLQIESVTSQSADCYGEASGSITIVISGGTAPYYYWYGGPKGNDEVYDVPGTSHTFTQVKSGNNYFIVVIDADDHEVNSSISVGEPAELMSFVSPDPAGICPATDLQFSGNPAGGNGGYVHEWTGSGAAFLNDAHIEDPVFNSGIPGDYNLIYRVTDQKGCESEQVIPVEVYPDLDADIDHTGVSCFGGNNGTITISNPSGGPGNYRYRITGKGWEDNGFFEGLSAGNYEIWIRNAGDPGCITLLDPAYTVSQPATAVEGSVESQTDVLCHGESTGIVTVAGSGGTSPYQYSLDGGTTLQGSGTFSLLAAGNYIVTVVDAGGCSFDVPVTITQPATALGGNITSQTDVLCHGESTGSVSAEGSGGEAPYQYSLDGVNWQADGIFSDLGADDYAIRIRDAKGCYITVNFTVTEPEFLNINAWHDDIDCFGDGNGVIYVSAQGGILPLTYRLFHSGVEIDLHASGDPVIFSQLAPGAYNVEVTDANGCITALEDDIILEEPDELTALVNHTNILCAGDTNGLIMIEASGGNGNFEYSVNNGDDFYANDGIFPNLSQGTYNIIVKDGSGCVTSGSQQVTLTEPPAIHPESVVITDASCYGKLDGSIQVTATGGTGILLYSLDNDSYQPAGFFGGLSAGGYTMYVKDESNCIRAFELNNVGQPEKLEVATEVHNIDCYDSGEPGISAVASGGTPPYAVSLYLDGVQVESVTGVAGNQLVYFESLTGNRTDYQVMVDDDNGCGPAISDILSTVVPEELVLELLVTTDLICHGTNEGIIEVGVGGGIAPYRYSLYNDQDDLAGELELEGQASFGQLPAGNYRVEIVDANGCGPLMVENIVIAGPPEIIISHLTISELKCSGDSDGVINIIAAGGTGSLEYSINGGAGFYDSGSFVGLAPGTFDVQVKDESGCIHDAGTFEIISPPELLFGFVDVADIIIGSPNQTGSIAVGMTGGTGPYSYSIDDGTSWQEGNLFGDLAEGEYGILVSDANGCMADTTVYLYETTGITASVITLMPLCHGSADGVITITADIGTEPYEYSIDDGMSLHSSGIFSGLPAGEYQVMVTDADNYVYRQTVLLTEPDPVVVTDMVTPAWCSRFNPDGTGTPDGAVNLTVSGGAGSYSYLWSNGAVTRDIGQLAAGDYSVTITDANNCEVMHAATVGYVNSIEVSLDESPVICHGTGIQLEPVVLTDASSVLYSWTASHGPDPQPVASPTVSPAAPTMYMLSVTDGNNCYDEAQVFVDLHPLQGLSIGNDTLVMQGAQIELEAKGGDFTSYQWAPSTGLSAVSGPVTSAVVMNSTEYFVRAETAEGCEEYAYITINVLIPVEPVSGFTPNGDGVNDMFDITNAGDYPNIVVEVFNRAGQRVFHSKGYSDDRRWDGTYNGRDLPVGTYYFVITLNDGFGTRPITGPVTIIR